MSDTLFPAFLELFGENYSFLLLKMTISLY